jgi:hypothetical protein
MSMTAKATKSKNARKGLCINHDKSSRVCCSCSTTFPTAISVISAELTAHLPPVLVDIIGSLIHNKNNCIGSVLIHATRRNYHMLCINCHRDLLKKTRKETNNDLSVCPSKNCGEKIKLCLVNETCIGDYTPGVRENPINSTAGN